ncbi:DUF6274 family protein [Streptomyces sp. bgisy032]|uniref:DUF6274 family protein n=1 Tax=Streptomyces sp. bgisy032 TaxID=3413773 RepID=UPI003D705F2B
MAASARHETRALLRAHLAAASSYRHLTRHCPICHRLLLLAMESAPLAQAPAVREKTPEGVAERSAKEGAEEVAEDGSPAPA